MNCGVRLVRVAALLPSAMLLKQASGAHKKLLTKPTEQLILSLSIPALCEHRI